MLWSDQSLALDRGRLQRRFSVLHVDLELDGAALVPGDQGVAVLRELDDELLEREAVGRLAALLLELDELFVDLAEVGVLALGRRLLRDDAREVGADGLERRREVEARRARRRLRHLADRAGRGLPDECLVEPR